MRRPQQAMSAHLPKSLTGLPAMPALRRIKPIRPPRYPGVHAGIHPERLQSLSSMARM